MPPSASNDQQSYDTAPPTYTFHAAAHPAPCPRLQGEWTPLLQVHQHHSWPLGNHSTSPRRSNYSLNRNGRVVFSTLLTISSLFIFFIYWIAFSGIPFFTPPSAEPPSPTGPASPPPPPPYKRHIAIIGAGPAGITTAYQLFLLCSQNSIPVHITIYDQSSHLGGRAVHPVLLPTGETIDIAASTFPESAKHLLSAARFLGLKTEPFSGAAKDLTSSRTGSFGVYDGRSWAYTEPHAGNFFDSGWWNPQLLSRYGNSVKLISDFTASARAKLASLYTPFSSLTDLIYSKLGPETTSTAEEFLTSAHVSTAFQRELLNPWTRGRYIQNLGTMTALGALAALDNIPLYSIASPRGMGALWERMANHSNATIALQTRVDALNKASWGGWELTFGATTTPYDAVVLATPWSLSSSLSIPSPPTSVTYESAHITLFISPSRLSPHPFHGNKNIPDVVLTTPCSWEYGRVSGESGADGLGQPKFWSLSRDRTIVYQGQRRWLYKVVSATEMRDEDLQALVGVGQNVAWVSRSYVPAFQPLLVPRRTFSRIRLDNNLWYTGGMEELLSGVEMASVIGSNVARLVVEQWKEEGLQPDKGRRIPDTSGI